MDDLVEHMSYLHPPVSGN